MSQNGNKDDRDSRLPEEDLNAEEEKPLLSRKEEEKPLDKVKIKIKLTTSQPKEEKEEEDDENKQTEMKICAYCNKGFSSGKALGGHVRVHIQEEKKLNGSTKKKCNKKLNISVKTQNRNLSPLQKDEGCSNKVNQIKDKSKHKCSICFKEFSSQKSLFGHMRSHPDRGWRGMNPPSGQGSSTSVTSSPTNPEAHMSSQNETEQEVLKAAHILMEIKFGKLPNGDKNKSLDESDGEEKNQADDLAKSVHESQEPQKGSTAVEKPLVQEANQNGTQSDMQEVPDEAKPRVLGFDLNKPPVDM